MVAFSYLDTAMKVLVDFRFLNRGVLLVKS
uniref:Uncharacterized protein n=1 Tax=Arundo donax TaxID=35708 RepID=A0A0A9D579_ARUDO